MLPSQPNTPQRKPGGSAYKSPNRFGKRQRLVAIASEGDELDENAETPGVARNADAAADGGGVGRDENFAERNHIEEGSDQDEDAFLHRGIKFKKSGSNNSGILANNSSDSMNSPINNHKNHSRKKHQRVTISVDHDDERDEDDDYHFHHDNNFSRQTTAPSSSSPSSQSMYHRVLNMFTSGSSNNSNGTLSRNYAVSENPSFNNNSSSNQQSSYFKRRMRRNYNKGDWFFNIQSTNEKIFWESYQESERIKIEENGFYKLKAFIPIIRHLWNKHVSLVSVVEHHSMWTEETKKFWIFFFDRTKYIGLTIFAFNVLSMTATFTNLMIYSFTNYANFNDFANQLRLAFVVYMMAWHCLNILCLGCYILFIWYDDFHDWISMIKNGNAKLSHIQGSSLVAKYETFFDYWNTVSRAVTATRAIFLIHIIVSTFTWWRDSSLTKDGNSGICLGLYYYPPGVHNFIYITLLLLFDVYQISVMAFFPAPWPWILRLCTFEWMATMWRVRSCAFLLGDFPMRENMVNGLCVIISIYYFVSVCLSTLSFEYGVRSTFGNIQRQHAAAEDKMKVINMLCKDIKLPAQQLIQTLMSIDSSAAKMNKLMQSSTKATSSKSNSDKVVASPPITDNATVIVTPTSSPVKGERGFKTPSTVERESIDKQSKPPSSLFFYIEQAKQCSSTLNKLVDDVLLLTKMQEGRFTMHCQDSINLFVLTKETFTLIAESMMTTVIPKSAWSGLYLMNTDAIPTSCPLKSEKHCFKILLYHSFMALLALVCDDKVDENLDKVYQRFINQQGYGLQNADNECGARCGAAENDQNDTMPWFSIHTELVPIGHQKRENLTRAASAKLNLKECMYLKVSIAIEVPALAFNDGTDSTISSGGKSSFKPVNGGLFESACLICHKVATAACGDWNIMTKNNSRHHQYRYEETKRQGLVELRIPCSSKYFQHTSTIGIDGGVGSLLDSIFSLSNDSASGILRTVPTEEMKVTERDLSNILSNIDSLVQAGAEEEAFDDPEALLNDVMDAAETGVDLEGDPTAILPMLLTARERKTVRKWIAKKAFVYLADVSFEPIMIDILHKLKIKSTAVAEIPMLRKLTVAEMKVYEVAFVHSIESCIEVRKKQFAGQIVLFCERVAYLDEEEKQHCDHVVPLPSSEADLASLMHFLFHTSRKKESRTSTSDEDAKKKVTELPSSGQQRFVIFRFIQATVAAFTLLLHKMRSVFTLDLTVFNGDNTVINNHATSRSSSGDIGYIANLARVKSSSYVNQGHCFLCNGISFFGKFLHDPIPKERRESFAHWRFLTPLGRILHHTLYLETLGFFWIMLMFIQLILGISSFFLFVIATTMLLLYYARRIVYFGILRHYNISLSTWWNCCSFLVGVFILCSFVVDFFYISFSGSGDENGFVFRFDVPRANREQKDMIEFSSSKHGLMTGMQTFFFLFYIPSSIRYYVEIFPWPFGYIFTIIVFLRGCLILRFYLYHYMYHTHNNLIIMALGCCTISSLFYQYFVLKLYVESFSTLYDLLLSKDFFDRVFLMGKTTMSLPLQRLQSMQTEVLEMITEKALQEELLLITPLYQQMTTLKVNLIVLKELRHYLNVMSLSETQYFQQQPRSMQQSRMKAKLIKTLVHSICAQFVQSMAGTVRTHGTNAIPGIGHEVSTFSFNSNSLGNGKDLTVKFVLRLHPALTLVKVDEDLFSSMLSFLLRQVIEKIERYVNHVKAKSFSAESRRNKTHGSIYVEEEEPSRFEEHEVLIWIRPPNASSTPSPDVNCASTRTSTTSSAIHPGGSSAAGSVFKFTDVRTMVVTLFDTCKPIPYDESPVSSGRDSKSALLLPGRTGSVYVPATSYALCDRFMRFFDSKVRYQIGDLTTQQSKHYHCFQEVGVPYMLCPDSYRLEKCVQMTKAMGDQLIHQIEKQALYRRYCCQYDDGMMSGLSKSRSIDEVDEINSANKDNSHNNQNKSAILTPARKKTAKKSSVGDSFFSPSSPSRIRPNKIGGLYSEGSRRRFAGQAVILAFDTRSIAAAHLLNSGNNSTSGSSSSDHDTNIKQFVGVSFLARATITAQFESIAWNCTSLTIGHIHEILFSKIVQSSDCLLLDANLRLVVSSSPLLLSTATLAEEIDFIANSNSSSSTTRFTSNIAGNVNATHDTSSSVLIADTKDIIHLLRHSGYEGLIVLLHQPSSASTTTTATTALSTSSISASVSTPSSPSHLPTTATNSSIVASTHSQSLSTNPNTLDSRQLFNPNIHAAKADFHCQLPLTIETIREISIATERHILSGL